jgi:hypothetical protein
LKVSLKSSGGLGAIPGFCVAGAGAGVCAAAVRAHATRAAAMKPVRLMSRAEAVLPTCDSSSETQMLPHKWRDYFARPV